MRFCIAGHSASGSSNLALRLSRLYPMHDFEALTYPLPEDEARDLSGFDGVLLTVSLLDGPMPGTRAAIADAVAQKKASAASASPIWMCSTSPPASSPVSRSWRRSSCGSWHPATASTTRPFPPAESPSFRAARRS